MFKIIFLISAFLVSGISGFTQKDDFEQPSIGGHFSKSSEFNTISGSGFVHGGIVLNNDYFECPIYGPFHVGDADFRATFKYRVNIDDQQILERLRIYVANGELLNAQTNTVKNYQNNALEEVDFTIPIRNCLSNKGITLKFEILKRSNREILKEFSATIYPVSTPNNNYQYYKNNVYESLPIAFYGDGQGMKAIKETINFKTIGDYLESDYYYRLDVKDKRLNYTSEFPLTYKSINLRFEDHENLFPYYKHTPTEHVIIPLDVVNSNGRLNLKYGTNFYINKRTLDTSNTYHNGFAYSPYFYMPINGKERFDNKIFYLDFEEFAQSKITVSFPLRFISGKAIVGTAPEGEYYISGGIAND